MSATRFGHAALLAATVVAALAGCAVADQAGFEREAASLVHEGMPVDDALAGLGRHDFLCSVSTSADPSEDCTRMRQHVLPPATCIERVAFRPMAGRVTKLEVAQIVCARA